MGASDERRGQGRGIRVALVLAACLAALIVVAPAAGGEGTGLIEHERCFYRRGGPPGPAGNALVIVSGFPARIVREGQDIEVRETFLRCTGRQATVHDIDEIVVRDDNEEGLKIDERGGRFAPGATPEAHGSEIEFRVHDPWIVVEGTEGSDHIVLGSPHGRPAIDLDAAADGRRPDYDVFETGRLPHLLEVDGGRGNDILDARRLRRIGDPGYHHRLKLYGGSGADALFGSPGDDAMLDDGPGADLIRGGGGNDRIWFRRGHDTVFGGRGDDDIYYAAFERFARFPPTDGSDRLFGGPGRDSLIDENRRPDLLDCGPGLDSVRREPHDRPAADCEETVRR